MEATTRASQMTFNSSKRNSTNKITKNTPRRSSRLSSTSSSSKRKKNVVKASLSSSSFSKTNLLDDVFSDSDSRPVILFDGVCNLCHGGVNFVLDTDNTPDGALRFAALQSELGKTLLEKAGKRRDDISSIVLVEKCEGQSNNNNNELKFYFKSDAVLRIGAKLGNFYGIPLSPFAKVANAFVPTFIRDTVYTAVASNRYNLLGKKDECRFDADGKFDERFLT
jgi:predicted DCC family thiol-disulfide oxidoreductase YuxK